MSYLDAKNVLPWWFLNWVSNQLVEIIRHLLQADWSKGTHPSFDSLNDLWGHRFHFYMWLKLTPRNLLSELSKLQKFGIQRLKSIFYCSLLKTLLFSYEGCSPITSVMLQSPHCGHEARGEVGEDVLTCLQFSVIAALASQLWMTVQFTLNIIRLIC